MSLYHTTHATPEFPKMKYAPTGGAVMVQNRTEELALGPGWTDTAPAEPQVDPDPEAKPAKKGKK